MHYFLRSPFHVSAVLSLLLLSTTARAQLTDVTQTQPTIAGGQIGKSLVQQVGTGRGSEVTPGSSIYLIKRDPARAIRRGRQLFQRKFTAAQGVGPRLNAISTGNITDKRALGAGMVDSCASCHGRPRGAAGFGGDVATRPDSRDAPHLFGLGLLEMLADEMTAKLRAQRDAAVLQATSAQCDDQSTAVCESSSSPNILCQLFGFLCPDVDCVPAKPCGTVTIGLTAKGVYFGKLTASHDGKVDFSELEGVDEDLRIKPFFAHGGTISMREFVIGALSAEMGLQATDPVLCAATDPVSPRRMVSPSGMVFDPKLDTFERPPLCDPGADGDRDGVHNEIDPALVDYFEFYLLNYFKPGRGHSDKFTATGLELLDEIGCTECHRQTLRVDRDRRVADVETVYNPSEGIFNRLFATVKPRFDIVEDGQRYPMLLPQKKAFTVKNVFTDLRRHDLGPAFHEREYDGTLVTEFMTRPLWGVATSSPYGHDGRSISLEEVILRHGGEASESRDNYADLTDGERHAVLDFLGTLVLFPPDDTASNLSPGDPLSPDIQDPKNHGSINLSSLYQIREEGAE